MIAIPAIPSQATRILPVALGIAAFDLMVKQVMEAWLGTGGSFWLIADQIGFELIHNRRMAFSLGPDSMVTTVIGLAAIAILIGFAITSLNTRDRLPAFAVALLLGGALGNLIDRLLHGYVVDYVAVFSFPRFNIADACLTIGITMLGFAELTRPRTPTDGTT